MEVALAVTTAKDAIRKKAANDNFNFFMFSTYWAKKSFYALWIAVFVPVLYFFIL